MREIGRSVPKQNARQLLAGKNNYTRERIPGGCLRLRLVKSTRAHAVIEEIDASRALDVPGVVCVLTAADAPEERYTAAGAEYPEDSPYDRRILDRVARYYGEPIAVVAAETEEAAERALLKIRVRYGDLPAVLSYQEAERSSVPVHGGGYEEPVPLNGDPARNIVGESLFAYGDLEREFALCDAVVEETYTTKANAQAMMEPFISLTDYDAEGRLTLVGSTQVPFYCRRLLARIFSLPEERVRVVKPAVGGAFGAKQSIVTELLCALVSVHTGRPAMLAFSREDCFTCSNSRHEMRIRVRMGASRDGVVRALEIDALSNAGAYAEHAYPTALLTGHRTAPLYQHARALRLHSKSVYTNTMPGGAMRGYGVPQGCFAVESAAALLAGRLNLDPVEFRLRNIPGEGSVMRAYWGACLSSSALSKCILAGKKRIGWDEKYPRKILPDGKIRAVGMAISMQGSSVAGRDRCGARVTLDADGGFVLWIGAAEMGMGCETVLAQLAAQTLECPVSRIRVAPIDTLDAPYDSGSYASSTTYATGGAVVAACLAWKRGERGTNPSRPESRADVTSAASPPPFAAGFAELELDPATGEIALLNYVIEIDCGTVINPALATVQAEGGVVMGVGMALYEDIKRDALGRSSVKSFLQYRLPTRAALPPVQVEFQESYEPTGPCGAKSIGEVVINTPCAAIGNALFHAAGLRFPALPFTPERVYAVLREGGFDLKHPQHGLL